MSRFREQQGIALVMALGVLVVMTIVTVSLLTYSSDNLRGIRYQGARVTAYSLAEAGINEALAVLNLSTNNPLDPNLLPETMSAYDGGDATWSGIFDDATATWTLTSTGTVANPTGAAAVTKTLTVHAAVTATLSQPLSNQAWNYIFAYKPNDGLYNADGSPQTCEMTINNSGNIATSVFVEGDLCLSNTSAITQGPNGTKVVVLGRLMLANTNQNWIGSVGTPVDEVYIGNGCKLQNNAVSPSPCSTADNVFSSQYDTSQPSLGSPPVPDWDGWYATSAPGPSFPCVASKSSASNTWPTFDNDGTRNTSVSTAWDLTPSTAYDCWTAGGELAWDPTTKVLTVNGTVFIDGSAYISNGAVNSYTGMGSLYLSGVFLLKNSKLCAVLLADASGCDTANWDPNQKALFIVANGSGDATISVPTGDSVQIKSAYFQGGIYGTNAVDIGTSSTVDGPMVGSTVSPGQSTSTSFPVISFVPTGAPGNQIVYSTLGAPTGYDG